jgi:DNA repair protein SbcC/Rad50
MSRPASGFIINEVELKGFMRYRDQVKIPFKNKFTVITGPTGSGKTSLLDGITFALYGSSSRTDEKMKIDEFLEKNGFVKISFTRNDQEYAVTRGRRNGKNYLSLARGNERIAGSASDLEHKVENLVGLDYIGFRNSTFIRQDEMKQIGSETGSERLKIFERLFRLEKFERAQEIADRKFRAAEAELVRKGKDLDHIKEEYSVTLPSERKKLAEADRNYSQLEKSLKQLRSRTAEIDQNITKLEASHKKYEAATQGIQQADGEIQQKKRELDEAIKQDEERSKLHLIIDKLRSYPQQKEMLDRQRESLEKKQVEYKHLVETRQQHVRTRDRLKENSVKDIEEARKDVIEQQERLKKLAKSLGRNEAFELLRREGALAERIARITKEVGWLKDLLPVSFIHTLTSEQKDAEKEVLRVTSRTKNITGDIFVKSDIEDRIKRLEDKVESLTGRAKEQVSSEVEAIKKIDGTIARTGFGTRETDVLRQTKKKLNQIQMHIREYDLVQKGLERLQDQTPLITNLKATLQRLGKKLQSFTEEENRLSSNEERYSKGITEKKRMEGELGDVRQRLGDAEGQKKILEGRVTELEKLGPEIKRLKEELGELEDQKEVFKILKQDVFHRKGILLYAITQLLQGIGIEASKILGDMTDQRLNKIRLAPNPDVRGGSIRIEVEGVDGLFHDVSVFSGGEKTQVNAALRFAISKELARMPQIGKSYGNMKTLFIDEGDLGSLDTESARSFFVNKLLSMGDLFERIILITHIAEIAERFPSRIRISMTPERYSRVEIGRAVA